MISNNFCASVYIPSLKPDVPYTLESVGLEIMSLTSHAVAVRYHTLQDFNPKVHDNWIGIWNGNESVTEFDPIRAVSIAETVNTGSSRTAQFNGFEVISGRSYTVAYFMNGWNKEKSKLDRPAMACRLEFGAEDIG